MERANLVDLYDLTCVKNEYDKKIKDAFNVCYYELDSLKNKLKWENDRNKYIFGILIMVISSKILWDLSI